MSASAIQPPRARPIAEPAVAALEARAGEIARRWAAALVLARPLAAIGEVPLERIADAGEDTCAMMLRALGDDDELARLTGSAGGDERPTASARALPGLVGARDAATVARAVEVLRGVVWEALEARLGETSGRRRAEAADRLAEVCAAVVEAALGTGGTRVEARAEGGGATGTPPFPGASAFPGAQPAERGSDSAVIVDERPVEVSTRTRPWPGMERRASPPAALKRSGLFGDPLADAAAIEARDVRHAEGPTAWIRAIGSQLESFSRTGQPFSVLVVELGDRGASVDERELAALEQLLLGAVAATDPEGPEQALTRERAGRYWLLASGLDRRAGQELAMRLVRDAAAGAGPGGRRLTLSIGTACCPADGTKPAALAAQADVGLYAARAARRAAAARPVEDSSR